MNTFRTTILLAVLFALFMWAGHALGGQQGTIIAFVMASVGSFFSYWFSDKMVIAMYRGQEITANDDPELYGIVQDLAQRAPRRKEKRKPRRSGAKVGIQSVASRSPWMRGRGLSAVASRQYSPMR